MVYSVYCIVHEKYMSGEQCMGSRRGYVVWIPSVLLCPKSAKFFSCSTYGLRVVFLGNDEGLLGE